jgi:hypothetical protein
MMQPSAGSQPNSKTFLDSYSIKVGQILEKLRSEREEPYPLLTGRVGTAIDDPSRTGNYV